MLAVRKSLIIQILPGKYASKSHGIQIPASQHELYCADHMHERYYIPLHICPKCSRSCIGDLICLMCGARKKEEANESHRRLLCQKVLTQQLPCYLSLTSEAVRLEKNKLRKKKKTGILEAKMRPATTPATYCDIASR